MKKLESLYIHFPFCISPCNYCDFFKFILNNLSKESDLRNFQVYLKDCLKYHETILSKSLFKWSSFETVYIGGGTPSLWGVNGAQFCRNLFKKILPGNSPFFTTNHEFTLEINPATWDEEALNAWIDLGVNRFSIGVQSLDNFFIKKIERSHSLDQTIKTLEYFNTKKLNFSVDFMLGLPESQIKKRNIVKELEEILKFRPEHISLYILTPKKGYKHFNSLPNDSWISKEYLEVANFLCEKKFIHYEVSNFAKSGKESKHNLKYWKSGPIGALGPSSTGFLPNKDLDCALRYKWKSNFSPCYETEKLGPDELKLERLYMQLRTNMGINPTEFFDKKSFCTFMKLVESWDKENLIDFQSTERVILSSRGFLILDTIINKLFFVL